MFQKARLKLTAWYLMIIMLVSGLFSVIIFTAINQELNHMSEFERRRQERSAQRLHQFVARVKIESEKQGIPLPDLPEPPRLLDEESIEELRMRTALILISINAGIFIVAGGAGYFLAGQTLKPIQKMVDEQKRFIGDASHELRTPLTALRTEIEVNLRNKDLTFAKSKALLQSNLEEVVSLQQLSNNLLTLTQYQHSSSKRMLTAISLKDIIDTSIKKVHMLAKEKQISFVKKGKNATFLGDPSELTELVVILLDNAIKYSERKSKVTITAHKNDGTIEIGVSDTGRGISEKDLPYIFDRFYQSDTARSKGENRGFGLGLSIAQMIVKRNKGIIRVESIPQKGATFIVQIPVKQVS